jgi:hypothetical protein
VIPLSKLPQLRHSTPQAPIASSEQIMRPQRPAIRDKQSGRKGHLALVMLGISGKPTATVVWDDTQATEAIAWERIEYA